MKQRFRKLKRRFSEIKRHFNSAKSLLTVLLCNFQLMFPYLNTAIMQYKPIKSLNNSSLRKHV